MSNARDLIKRNNAGQFLKGSKGLGGRKPGSKNKLATQYSDDLYRKWKQYGPGCLDTLGKAAIDGDTQAAKAFVTAVGQHLPKDVTAKMFSESIELPGDQAKHFAMAYDLALELAQQAPMIEHDHADFEDTETQGY